MKKAKILIGMVAILFFVSNYTFGQVKCLYWVSSESLSAADQVLFDKMTEWEFEVTARVSTEAAWMDEEEFLAFDFMLASESIDSGGLNAIKTIPLPFINMEGWCVKPGAMDWQTDRDVNNYSPEPVKIVDNTGHPLAAGFASGATVTLCTEGYIVGSVPQIDIIPIAGMSSDETKLVIYGIEAGTLNAVGDTIQNKVATIGIHAEGYQSMTDDAFTLLKAGIDWVTPETAVEEEGQFIPAQFELAQNYPNPFNPTTQIQYTLGKNTKVEIAVYDLLGQKVATLVNGYQSAGSHKVIWDASEASAGVYLYQMKTNDAVVSKKMILIK